MSNPTRAERLDNIRTAARVAADNDRISESVQKEIRRLSFKSHADADKLEQRLVDEIEHAEKRAPTRPGAGVAKRKKGRQRERKRRRNRKRRERDKGQKPKKDASTRGAEADAEEDLMPARAMAGQIANRFGVITSNPSHHFPASARRAEDGTPDAQGPLVTRAAVEARKEELAEKRDRQNRAKLARK